MGFKYIRKITLTNSSAFDITTAFNVKLDFDNTNFYFTHCNSDGSDIRFFDSDQTTPLVYYIENWDSVGQVGTIYLKIPSILASSTKDIYMMYGDPLLTTSTSSEIDTWINATWIPGTVTAYYKLDGNANDESGNYNGIWSGTEQYDIGKLGQAAKFDGSSDISTSYIPDLTSSLSFGFFANYFTLPSGTGAYCFGYRNNGEGLHIGSWDGNFFVGIYHNYTWYSTTTTNTANSMRHYVVTWDPATLTVKLYVNGILTTNNNTSVGGSGNGGFKIGSSADNVYYFNGLIDQTRFFNRVLTPDEAFNLYNEKYPATINDLYYYNPNSNVSFIMSGEALVVAQLFLHNF